MICELWIKFFFCPFGILWYKFLSYIEVLHVLSEPSKLPEVFSSMKKHLFHGALRLGDPLLELLELRFVSLSSIGSHPAFPDVLYASQMKGPWGSLLCTTSEVSLPCIQDTSCQPWGQTWAMGPKDSVGSQWMLDWSPDWVPHWEPGHSAQNV